MSEGDDFLNIILPQSEPKYQEKAASALHHISSFRGGILRRSASCRHASSRIPVRLYSALNEEIGAASPVISHPEEDIWYLCLCLCLVPSTRSFWDSQLPRLHHSRITNCQPSARYVILGIQSCYHPFKVEQLFTGIASIAPLLHLLCLSCCQRGGLHFGFTAPLGTGELSWQPVWLGVLYWSCRPSVRSRIACET